MKLKKEQIERGKAPYGRVLIHLERLQKETTKSGLEIVTYSDDSIGQFSTRTGIVIDANLDTDIPESNYSFIGECEVQKGDKVWFTQSAIMEIIKLGKAEMNIIESEEDMYVLLNYQDLILRERDGEYLGLNDKVIAKPIQPITSSLLDLSMTSSGKPRQDLLEVVYTPSFKGEYRDIKVGNTRIKVNERVTLCSKGDKVLLMCKGAKIVFLEDKSTGELEDNLVYFKSTQIGEIR